MGVYVIDELGAKRVCVLLRLTVRMLDMRIRMINQIAISKVRSKSRFCQVRQSTMKQDPSTRLEAEP